MIPAFLETITAPSNPKASPVATNIEGIATFRDVLGEFEAKTAVLPEAEVVNFSTAQTDTRMAEAVPGDIAPDIGALLIDPADPGKGLPLTGEAPPPPVIPVPLAPINQPTLPSSSKPPATANDKASLTAVAGPLGPTEDTPPVQQPKINASSDRPSAAGDWARAPLPQVQSTDDEMLDREPDLGEQSATDLAANPEALVFSAQQVPLREAKTLMSDGKSPRATELVQIRQNKPPVSDARIARAELLPGGRGDPGHGFEANELPAPRNAAAAVADELAAQASKAAQASPPRTKPDTPSQSPTPVVSDAIQTTATTDVGLASSLGAFQPDAKPSPAPVSAQVPDQAATSLTTQASAQPTLEGAPQGTNQAAQLEQSAPGPIAELRVEARAEARLEARPPEQRAMQTIDTAINQLDEARGMAQATKPELTLRHHDFGAITMRLETLGNDLRATLSARDPGFVPAIQAALAERAVIASSEGSASQSYNPNQQQRGNDQGNANSPSGGQGWQSEARYGSSTGSGQGAYQPYQGQTEIREEDNGSQPRTAATQGASDGSESPGDRDLFA